MSLFTMPSLGADMEEGKLIEWLVKPGARMSKGAIEIEIFGAGEIGALRTAFIAELTAAAPDLDPGMIGDDDHLQDDLGLDSMDFLNLVSALYKRFALPIPEADYPRLATAAKAVAYLAEKLG